MACQCLLDQHFQEYFIFKNICCQNDCNLGSMKPLCRPSYGCLAKITFLIWVASSLLALPRFSIILSHLLLEVGEPDFRSIILPLVHKTFNHSNHFDRPISSAGPSQRSTPFKRLKAEKQGKNISFSFRIKIFNRENLFCLFQI